MVFHFEDFDFEPFMTKLFTIQQIMTKNTNFTNFFIEI